VHISYFKTLWGAVGVGTPHRNFASALSAVVEENWDGVVYAPVLARSDPTHGPLEELAELCVDSSLELAVVVHTWGNDLETHLRELKDVLTHAAAVEPCHVIVQAGLDKFDIDQTDALLARTAELAADLGVTVAHETHRHRPLFTPWATERVLDRHPDIRLVVDLSHWVVALERLLPDEEDIIRRAGRHAIQIDARVGHEECAQVPDPSAPEWAEHTSTFEQWWTTTRDEAEVSGLERLVVVPEYGPPPYQQALPRTGAVTTDLWETCLTQRRRLERLLGEKT